MASLCRGLASFGGEGLCACRYGAGIPGGGDCRARCGGFRLVGQLCVVCRAGGRSGFHVVPDDRRDECRGALLVADGLETGVVESGFSGCGYSSDLSGAEVVRPFVRFVAGFVVRGFLRRCCLCLAAGRWLYLRAAPDRDLNRRFYCTCLWEGTVLFNFAMLVFLALSRHSPQAASALETLLGCEQPTLPANPEAACGLW